MAAPSAEISNPSLSERAPRRWYVDVLAISLLVLWAAWLIRPWQSGVLEYADLTTLREVHEAQGDWDTRVARWMSHNVQYGRFFPVHVVSTFSLWGTLNDSAVAWQTWRFVSMLVVLVLCYALLRRLGCTRVGAWVGCLLVVCSSAIVNLHLKLYLSESIGMVAGLVGALAAVTYATSRRWKLRAFAIAGCLVIAGWTRETLIAYVPFVLLLSIPPGHLRDILRFVASPRFRWLAGVCVLATTAVVIPALLVSRAGLYTVSYGPASIGIGTVANAMTGVLLPITRQWFFPPNVFVWLTIAAGAFVAWRTGRPNMLWPMIVATALLLVGALIYVPWPVFLGYYAAPVLPGLALLLGVAVSEIQRSRRRGLLGLAGLCVVTVLLYGTMVARYLVLDFRANVALEADLAKELSSTPAESRVFVTARPPDDPAFAMSHYARGMLRLPVGASVEPVTCDEASAPNMKGKTIWLVAQCSTAPPWEGRNIVRRIEYRHWRTLRRRTDSLYAVVREDQAAVGATRSDAPPPSVSGAR